MDPTKKSGFKDSSNQNAGEANSNSERARSEWLLGMCGFDPYTKSGQAGAPQDQKISISPKPSMSSKNSKPPGQAPNMGIRRHDSQLSCGLRVDIHSRFFDHFAFIFRFAHVNYTCAKIFRTKIEGLCLA